MGMVREGEDHGMDLIANSGCLGVGECERVGDRRRLNLSKPDGRGSMEAGARGSTGEMKDEIPPLRSG
jgi:hypothetical protein